MADLPSTFGQWLARRRKEYGYTQEQLARVVGYSIFMIEKIEEGTRRPSRKMVQVLLENLGVSEEEKDRLMQLARRRPYGAPEGGPVGKVEKVEMVALSDLGVAVILVAISDHSSPTAQQVASAIADALGKGETDENGENKARFSGSK